jgi:type IV pilus assembly protein PilC
MIFKYKAVTSTGEQKIGTIEAFNVDIAINQLQKTGLIISTIYSDEDKKAKIPLFAFFDRVTNKDVVILSRQIATLFQAQVPALRIFRLLSEEAENPTLKKYLASISEDIQGGSSISNAIEKYPSTFSGFYVNMVRSGEESGKLDEIFEYLADYMDRTYEVTSKARNALIYPAFIIITFIGVMVLMFTVIIPKIALMIVDSGQSVPFYTQIVLWISGFLVNNIVLILIFIIVVSYLLLRYVKTDEGSIQFDKFKLDVPYIGDLYRKLYLSRISDNLNTMIISGIPIIKALEITASVVDNKIYNAILNEALKKVKEGTPLSQAFNEHSEIPPLLTQMIKVGEETGELGKILKSLSRFYQREVTSAVDTLVGLIEPVMIVALGLGVGFLLAAVLMPIYNIASAT